MTEAPKLVLEFWGKTPAGDDASQFHPALYHMLDVACVADVLLSEQAPARLRHALRYAWRGCDWEALRSWLPFLIALHDLGKISAAFQGQTKSEATRLQRERLEAQGVRFPAYTETPPYHAEISAVWVHEKLTEREQGVPLQLKNALRDALSGHHGHFSKQKMVEISRSLAASERNDPNWAHWRNQSYNFLRELLEPAGALAAVGAPRCLRPATVTLTGFIILCDWLGSNNNYFQATPRVEAKAYLDLCRKRAAQAVKLAGLSDCHPAPVYRNFLALFKQEPRGLQEAIDQLPQERLAGPLLAVIEAPTGEGKTEAALALAQRMGTQLGVDELFFALPTMATSNQMFGRLSKLYRQLHGAEVRLTHSQSLVVEEDLRRSSFANDYDAVAPAAANALTAIEWFSGPKKAMLAPFGVGTVDQVELGGLNVRHYMLRLLALAGKVVIIDEVHAYDAYMSEILEHTLSWLASLGTSVILLSATLPASRQRALAAGYYRGLDQLVPPPDVPDTLCYPAISLYSGAGQHRVEKIATFRSEQCFVLRLVAQLPPEQEAERLLELVRAGGAIARICNRVDTAQAIYRALLARCSSEQAHVLLHARIPLEERQKREGAITSHVGKESTRTPQQPIIIIGTQVLEQSLDYDVDLMISDFAPIDLLLQRAGRLHRHTRLRPAAHTDPVLEVVLSLTAEGLPDWQRWVNIYEPYVLWRTWEVLREQMSANERQIVLPDEYRVLIEAVYQPTPQLVQGAPYAAALAQCWAELQATRAEMEQAAKLQLIPAAIRHKDFPGPADKLIADPITAAADLTWIEDTSDGLAGSKIAKTRLGDQITVVPVYRVNGQLSINSQAGSGWELSNDQAPSLQDQKYLLNRSFSINDARLIKAFRDEGRKELHWPWRELPALLRSIYPLVLTSDNTAVIDGRTVRLDTELGFIIDKEGA